MSFDPYELDRSYGRAPAESPARYTAKTFMWMFLGLLVSFATGLALIFTGAVWYIFSSGAVIMLLVLLELGTVIYLSARIQRMSVGTATLLFFFYAVLNGVVISSALLLYGLVEAILVFALTALYFGVLAAYGYLTKRNLARVGPILTSGLIFLVVFWVLALFLPLSGLEIIVSMIGIAVFLGCTAYDTQKIQFFYQYYAGYPDMLAKASIFSALQLYLDFINLFLYLLRLLGNGKRS